MTNNVWFGDHGKRSVVTAGAWATAANLGSAVLSVTGTVFLSRLLDPADVGLFALAFSFYSIPSLVIGPGLTAAAVQAPHLTEQQSSNLFWINTAANFAMAVLLVACAPLLASLFHQPMLQALCPVLSLVLILEGAATQYRALLQRAMRFDIIAATQLGVGSASLVVAVVLAWIGFGVWALVAHVLCSAILDRIVVAAIVPWRPKWPKKGAGLRRMIHFSAGSSLSLAMHMLYSQSQALLLGRFASVAEIGFYNRGQALFQKPFAQLMGPLYAVLLPTLAARQQSPDNLGMIVYRANSMLYTLLPPLALWLMVSGKRIATFLLGPAWEEAGDALFWFAVAALPGILFGTLYKANDAIGRPTWGMGIRLSFLPVLLGALLWAASRGASTMAAAGAAVEWASAPVIFWLLVKDGPIKTQYFAAAMAECVAAMVISGVGAWLLHSRLDQMSLPLMTHLAVSFACCFAVSLAVATLFPFGRAAIREWNKLIRLAQRRERVPSV